MPRTRVYVLWVCLIIMICPGIGRADDDWGMLSGRLSPRMTENQVMQAVGYRPNKVELKTCGNESPNGPWQCKVFTFGGLYSNLTVLFFDDVSTGLWRVNSWSVYP
jgi:hypothetical protein